MDNIELVGFSMHRQNREAFGLSLSTETEPHPRQRQKQPSLPRREEKDPHELEWVQKETDISGPETPSQQQRVQLTCPAEPLVSVVNGSATALKFLTNLR